MSPNLLYSARSSFNRQRGSRPWMIRRDLNHEHGIRTRTLTPVSGSYTHVPGRGVFLTAIDRADGLQDSVQPPRQVEYSKVLHRYLFEDEYVARKRQGKFHYWTDGDVTVGFFRLDDGVSYINCFDHKGWFVGGPYRLYCLGESTGRFRPMQKSDGKRVVGIRRVGDSACKCVETESRWTAAQSLRPPVPASKTMPEVLAHEALLNVPATTSAMTTRTPSLWYSTSSHRGVVWKATIKMCSSGIGHNMIQAATV